TTNLIERLNSDIEVGIKTGLAKYDKFTGGLHCSDLTLIAAETSQGKTSLALTIFKNCVFNGSKAAIFSLEMTKEQLVSRITAQETGIGAKNIMYNKLNPVEKQTVITQLLELQDMPIFFDESTSNDIDKICTSIRKLKIKHDINLVLVDYIQDMKGANDESGIAEIGRKLKNIAKELDISVVAISQLSRDKNNPEPNRARLRGSGQLEEKADIVLLLYRPEEYGRTYSEPHEMTETLSTAQVKIAKGRNVGTGSFILGFNKETTNFYDYAEGRIVPPDEF
ncbi:MAG: DnaB-like helicase C-terminal domain-containing protein, partial [Candidatus Neomarinimicrobiota bacterium]